MAFELHRLRHAESHVDFITNVLAMFNFAQSGTNVEVEMHGVRLGKEMLAVRRKECFKRRAKTLLDLYIARSVLVQYDAETTFG